MAKTLTPKDAHVIMGALVRQATGQSNISIQTTNDFVSAGQTVLQTGMENVFNSINILMGRIIIASRPYKALLTLMDSIETGEFTHRFEKVSFYSLDPMASGNFNTDLYTNLADGFTAGENKDANGDPQSTKSQWEQNQRPCKVFNFGGSDVWDTCITLYEDQVQQAFRNEEEFNRFIAGYIREHENDYESQREAFNRMIMLNKIGQVYDMDAMYSAMPGSVINLTDAYNTKFGTNYTSEQLRTTYLKSFAEFFVAEFKAQSEYMRERSARYHWSVPITYRGKTHNILRHTPYADQRVYLFDRLFKDVEALVMPEIFNEQYLDIDTQYQAVSYWQSNYSDAVRPQVKVKPAVVNPSNGLQTEGNAVELPYVVGMICDRDAMLTDFQIETARTTPVEARKGYRNTWLHVAKNGICDPTENTILFIMKDPTPGPVSSFVDHNRTTSLSDVQDQLDVLKDEVDKKSTTSKKASK